MARLNDRRVMAGYVKELVRAPWSWEEEELDGTRELWVTLKGPRGLQLTIDLDGDSKQQRQGVFVLAWVIRGDEGAKLNPDVMHGCNPFHFCKLTEVAYSFNAMLALIAKRMAQATDGSAFQ